MIGSQLLEYGGGSKPLFHVGDLVHTFQNIDQEMYHCYRFLGCEASKLDPIRITTNKGRVRKIEK